MIEFLSLIIYILMFTLSFLFLSLGFKTNKYSRVLIISALSIPVLLASIRYGVGTDYFNYKNQFDHTDEINFFEYIEKNLFFEIGNLIIRKISYVVNSYHLMLFLYSLITVSFIYLSIKKHRSKISVSISFFIFLCIYYPSSLNLMSQFAALSIVALSFNFIFEKNLTKFSGLIFLASCFHTTALFAFPLYFLWNKDKNDIVSKWLILIIIIVFIGITFSYQEILSLLTPFEVFSQYSIYVLENNEGQNRDIFWKILLLSIILIFSKFLIRFDKRNKLYILLIVFSVILGITGYASPWIKRLGLYFEIVQIFLLPGIIQLFKTKHERFIIQIGVYIYSITYFILVFYLLGQSNIIPYNIFFW